MHDQQVKTFNYLAIANTFVEWAEYSFFLFLGPIISQLFFPSYSSQSGLLMTYGVFTTSFVIRPISSLLFGYFSDKIGRKPPMVIAMVLMGIATLSIGILPTYEKIGFLSPLLLLLCRILQSISVSGEFQSSAIFLMEHEKNNKAFAGSLIIASASGGMFIGGLIASIVSSTSNLSITWRLPFIATGLLTIALSILRTRLQETPVFANMLLEKKLSKNPIVNLKFYGPELTHVIAIAAFICVFVYTCNGYYSSYLIQHASFSAASASLHCSITELIVAILAPLIAYYYGRNNNDKILLLGIIGLTINAPFQFYVANIQAYPIIVASLFVYAMFDAMVTSSIAYHLYNTFPANLKCTGVGFGWNLAAALFGGTAPLLSANLVNKGFMIGPGILVVTYGIIAIAVLSRNLKTLDTLSLINVHKP